jgi:membrane protein
MLEKILGPLARRWRWLRTALDVQDRYGEVRGNYLAAAVALNVFVAIFPLLLVAIAIIGLITTNDHAIADRIVSNAGMNSDQARLFTDTLDKAAETKKAASIIGLAGLLWTGLGVVAAIEYAIDATWQVTGRGIKDKVRGLVWGIGALAIFGASVALTATVDYFADGFVLNGLTVLGALGINLLLWMWTFNVLSFRRVHWAGYLPGAILAAVGLEVIKQISSLLPGLLAGSSALYGSLGIVFGVLAALVLVARLIVYASVLNVVKWEHHKGTVTVEVEAPRIPGVVPVEADRAGAIEEK